MVLSFHEAQLNTPLLGNVRLYNFPVGNIQNFLLPSWNTFPKILCTLKAYLWRISFHILSLFFWLTNNTESAICTISTYLFFLYSLRFSPPLCPFGSWELLCHKRRTELQFLWQTTQQDDLVAVCWVVAVITTKKGLPTWFPVGE